MVMRQKKYTQNRGNIQSHLTSVFIFSLLLFVTMKLVGEDNPRAFPGAIGWGIETKGPWSHPDVISGAIEPEIIRVTTLDRFNHRGDGSLISALLAEGPRIIVFEVGGVIDWEWTHFSNINPYLWIAGQTAPSPGITIIKGGLYLYNLHDIIIQHIAIRTGEHPDATEENPRWSYTLLNRDSYNLIIDHCSLIWGTRMNSIIHSANDFDGDTPEEWRINSPRNITFSNNIISEAINGLWKDPPQVGLGFLVGINVNRLAYLRNLWSYNYTRNPHIYAGSWGAYVNNYVRGHDMYVVSHVLGPELWGDNPWENARWSLIGNYAVRSPYQRQYGTPSKNPGIFHKYNYGDVELYVDENLYFETDEATLVEELYTKMGTEGEIIFLEEKPLWHDSIEVLPAADVPAYIEANVGARPWDRDPIDRRIVEEAMNGTGSLPDSDTWGPFPDYEPTYRVFNPDDWDLRSMIPHAGYWEALVPTSPENNAVDVGQNPTFQWSAEDYLTDFTIQIATDEEFSEIVVDEADITGSSYTVNNLNGSAAYYWRIRGHNATGPSQWSEVRRFNTGSAGGHTEIPLHTGWNLMSCNIIPNNPSIVNIFGSLGDKLVIVKDQSDKVFWPEEGVNTIGQWDYTQGYSVYMTDNAMLTVYGDEIRPEVTPLHLNQGWNLIPYLRKSPMSISDALSTIIDKIYLIKNNNGEHYWPEYNINTIGHLVPGQGYQVYLSEDATLLYPAN
jgi:hypothetical protein